MSNQNPGTPRFYINWLDFLVSNFSITTPTLKTKETWSSEVEVEDKELMRLISLSNRRAYYIDLKEGLEYAEIVYTFDDPSLTLNHEMLMLMNFRGVLGHNFADVKPEDSSSFVVMDMKIRYESTDSNGNPSYITIGFTDSNSNEYGGDRLGFDEETNWNGFWITKGSFDIYSMLDSENENIVKSISFKIYDTRGYTMSGFATGTTHIEISNLLFGRNFDMPKAPDLSLTLSREYDGIQKSKASGGSTISSYKYLRPPGFGNQGYFERSNQQYSLSRYPSRTGRKRWNLGFKFLESGEPSSSWSSSNTTGDIFNSQENIYTDGGDTQFNMYGQDSFFSSVIHRTEGGSRPFIFLPDKTNFNTDQWAVCTFSQDTFEFSQTAPGLYDISLDIVESW